MIEETFCFDEDELSLEEGALLLRRHGYDRITAESLYFMGKKLEWGPQLRYRPECGAFVRKSELLTWLKREDELANERERIDLEEKRLQSLRQRPIWIILGPDEPGLSELMEVVNAYDCDAVHIGDIGSVHEYVDRHHPDAAIIVVGAFDSKEISQTIEDFVQQGIYCVLDGTLPEGAAPNDILRQCAQYKGCAYANDRSVYCSAPSHLALRMNLEKGLRFEHKQALADLKERAWNG